MLLNFHHLKSSITCFFCYRGSRSPGKCNFCTRFYIEEIDQAMFIEKTFAFIITPLEKNFRVYHYSIQHTNVSKLLSQVKAKSFSLNLHYQVGDFLNYDPASKNYGVIFTEIVNNPFSLYLMYLEIFFRVYFNELKAINETIIGNYFIEKNIEPCLVKKNKSMILFTLNKLYFLHGKSLLRCLNVCFDGDIFE